MKIFAFVSDLFFLTRIESAARIAGREIQFIESPSDVLAEKGLQPEENPGEALHGREGALVRWMTEAHPSLLIFDIADENIPWKAWIALLKMSPATRRIPILAFGSHMDVETMTAARDAGADQVVARSKFVSDLPALIQKNIRVLDVTAIQADCEGQVSELALAGIDLFNQGAYFEAHELLEDAWNEDQGAARELYRAILQIAVAFLQIERGNFRGAAKMFLRVRQWIDPLPDVCRGVDVAGLKSNYLRVENELLRLGEKQIDQLDKNLFQPVRFLDS